MGRIYSGQFNSVNYDTSVQDLFEILLTATVVGILHEVKITQESDAGDAQSEQIAYQIKRGIGNTSGSGGTTLAPNKHETGDAASVDAAIELNNTTQAIAGGGSLITILEDCQNIHNGWHYLPTPEARIIFAPSEAIIVSIETIPSDTITLSGYVVWEELG